ncbi:MULTISPECIES: hypothetical protein [unclassified Arenibacter]|uniref:hypothetical protein n=1 Tax=unclassified Arenibacter TaxID=2615047 RepID=UPI000E907708|nr:MULTISPECIES: hypothetical protein [unclassified Arenibacter]MCM4162163.1 hypothetical protein [Arenibacter sp. A80]RFT57776.1 hypothetical protein D0S24_01005 [Arenibacter sp. P308M17]
MNNLEKIAINVRESFDQLWSFKLRGKDTIEISTPYSTTTSKFVSIYVTERGGKYIVSDGGLLNSEAYESEIDYENQCLLKILYHFEAYYEVKRTEDKQGIKHYYKTTTKANLIPNMVYEMAQFVSMCASAATVQFEDAKEIEERNTFRTKANTYIGSNLKEYNPIFQASLDRDEYRSVRFSALIERRNRLSLVSFVTGSNPSNFRNCIARTNMNFEIAASSKYKDHIDNKLVLVNNTADGFEYNQISKQLFILEEHTGQEAIFWTEREKLVAILK